MKNLLKIIAGLLLVSSFTFANDNVTGPGETDTESLKMGMYFDQSSGMVKTFFKKEVGSILNVSFSDSKGRVLNQVYINKKRNGARVNFDISMLENGTYNLEASHNGDVIKKTIVLERVNPSKMKNYNMEIL
ncbi:MAG: hypothetical protein ACI9DJ_002050 [Algoriphagus sp.]|jgi:hypothetical protein